MSKQRSKTTEQNKETKKKQSSKCLDLIFLTFMPISRFWVPDPWKLEHSTTAQLRHQYYLVQQLPKMQWIFTLPFFSEEEKENKR